MVENYKKPIKQTDADTLMALAIPMIEQGKTVKLTVTGISMYPLVYTRRDAVLLAKADSIKVGDVPLYQRPNGKYVLHRILKEKDGAYGIMGDSEIKMEYPVYPEQIRAKAIGFYRKGRYIDCNSLPYKAYSFFWRHTVKIRPYLIKTIIKMAGKRNKRASK